MSRSPGTDRFRAAAPAPPPPAFVDVRGERFAYLAAGPAAAPLVLCLHGFPDHAPSMWPLVVRFASAGYRAVAPWLRGYAPSTLAGPYDADQLAADAIGLADALSAPGAPVRIVGHDWGAVATYAALAAAPGRFAAAVALSVPHPLAFFANLRRYPGQLVRSRYMLYFQLPHLPERALERSDGALVDRLWRAWSPGYALPPDSRRALLACLRASSPAPIAYYRALARPLPAAIARARRLAARPIADPVLYLHGADDGCIAPDVAAGQRQWFRGPLRSQVIPDAGHFLPLEATDTVADAALAWFTTAR
ncbi:MAG: alpha/beta hydrolase [Deltaproteobacteria bacterium]|nr:MAG: alpha/beta hydrolase [Deltaproteobacteria bacterium]